MAYGLSASADGNLFPWIFNPPATYWDGASAFVRHAADVEGGFDKLKGKTIGLVHLDAPYGKEPIPLLQALAQDYGFTLKLYPVPGSADAEPDFALARRASRPARLDLYAGLGRHEPDRAQGSDQNRLPNGPLCWRLVVGGRGRRASGWRRAKGYTSLDLNGVGTNYPAIQDILKYVVDKGKSQVPSKDKVGENLYNRAVMNAVLIAEAIRTAQQV